MDLHGLGALAGVVTGGMVWCAGRFPALGFVATAPLGFALAVYSPLEAALAGALAGATGNVASVARREFRALIPLTVVPPAVAGALAAAIGSLAVGRLGLAALVLALPLVAVATALPLRILGAPRWVANPLACTQEPWLPVVHTARLGGDLVTSALLALSASVVALGAAAWVTAETSARVLGAALAALAVVAAALAFGARSVRRAITRREGSVRVAAVVVDGPPPPGGQVDGLWPLRSPDYLDVEGTVRRYDPHVRSAVAAGAEIVVLPEVAVNVDELTRERWADAVRAWAAEHDVVVVAPRFDRDVPVNTLSIVDVRGATSDYDKQHPARGLEPAPRAPTPPGRRVVETRSGPVALSAVICVDLDYADLVAPVAASGGLLAAPSNDWFGGFERLHHRTAVWAAALSGVPIVRAAGHGISAVFDGAGRVLAERSSADGPVVLVVDAPVAAAPTASDAPLRKSSSPAARAMRAAGSRRVARLGPPARTAR